MALTITRYGTGRGTGDGFKGCLIQLESRYLPLSRETWQGSFLFTLLPDTDDITRLPCSLPVFSFSKMESHIWMKNRRRKLNTTSWLGTGKFAGKACFSQCLGSFFVTGVFLHVLWVGVLPPECGDLAPSPLTGAASAACTQPNKCWCFHPAPEWRNHSLHWGWFQCWKMKGEKKKNRLLIWYSEQQEVHSRAKVRDGCEMLCWPSVWFRDFRGKSRVTLTMQVTCLMLNMSPLVLGPAVFPEGRISSFVFLWPLVPVVYLKPCPPLERGQEGCSEWSIVC